MKFAKMVRITAAFTLVAASVLNIYVHYRTNESYKKLRLSINDLKSRMYELRAVANSISRQIRPEGDNILSDRLNNRDFNDGSLNNKSIKYTVINKNGVIGVFNAEKQLVAQKKLKKSLVEDENLLRGISINGEAELDRLLECLGCEEETAQV